MRAAAQAAGPGAPLRWAPGPPWGPREGETKAEWGPRAWAWLHGEAIGYPEAPTPAEARGAFQRFWAFVQRLPCPECRLHATAYARGAPPNFSGGEGYQAWAWRFHNAVNYRLGKPLMPPGEYRRAYSPELAARYSGCLAMGGGGGGR